MSRIVLAYSGGLDTSVLLKRLLNSGNEVVTLTADLGESDAATGDDAALHLAQVRAKALTLGAREAIVVDARDRFVRSFAWPALRANAMYEGVYPLSAALSRPLIAELLVETARVTGADAVAHGCTGKGNDQVRIEVTVQAIDPRIRCLAPLRDAPMSRPDAIAFARQHGVPVSHTADKPYSIDANVWGRSIEAGVLENPWTAPPSDAFAWTRDTATALSRETIVSFERGVPVALDGERFAPSSLIALLNRVAGECGVGRIDHVESRLVGFKSREIYEAPAALTLIAAHRALESLVLSRDELRFKAGVEQRYAELIYDGLWRSPLREQLDAFVDASQARVSGDVRVALERGRIGVNGVRSDHSLYRENLATYGEGDAFDHAAAGGFITVWGMPLALGASRSALGASRSAAAETAGR